MMRSVDWSGLSERALVEAATAGDPSAFDTLARRYRPTAVLLARQAGASRDAAEDVAQDALLSAFKSLPQLQDPSRFAAWLGSIVRHRAHRVRQLRDNSMVQLDSLIIASLPSLSDPVRTESEVARAIDDLPDELGSVAAPYYLDDWSTGQIAAFLSIPVTTVKWRLHAARKLLRPRLAVALEIPYDE